MLMCMNGSPNRLREMLSMKGIGYSVQENVINFSMEKFLVQIQSGVIYISMTIVKGKKNY